MDTAKRAWPDEGSHSRHEAIGAIVGRITAGLKDLEGELAARYRTEILDYSTLDESILFGDVIAISLDNLASLLRNLESGDLVDPDDLKRFRESGARRVHQGVPLEAVLHAYRLWGQVVWQAFVKAADPGQSGETEAALLIAGRVIEHINVVSTVVAQGYLDEAQGLWSDREVVRRDLLEAVISGKAGLPAVRREASSLGLQLSDNYVVILARRVETQVDDAEPRPSPQAAMRDVVDQMKQHLRPAAGSLLVGLRHDEVVALYPLHVPSDLDTVHTQTVGLALAVAPDAFRVGIGGWHPGPSGVASGYPEARSALDMAVRRDAAGRPILFEDVLIEHVLRSDPKSERLLTETLSPAVEYDERSGTNLVETLRAYVDNGFSITKSAAALCVHPNTVVYRLKRVKELTGRDPNLSTDLVLLSLGLKFVEMDRTSGLSGPLSPA